MRRCRRRWGNEEEDEVGMGVCVWMALVWASGTASDRPQLFCSAPAERRGHPPAGSFRSQEASTRGTPPQASVGDLLWKEATSAFWHNPLRIPPPTRHSISASARPSPIQTLCGPRRPSTKIRCQLLAMACTIRCSVSPTDPPCSSTGAGTPPPDAPRDGGLWGSRPGPYELGSPLFPIALH